MSVFTVIYSGASFSLLLSVSSLRAGEVRITSVMVTNRLGRERHDNLLIDLVFSYF